MLERRVIAVGLSGATPEAWLAALAAQKMQIGPVPDVESLQSGLRSTDVIVLAPGGSDVDVERAVAQLRLRTEAAILAVCGISRQPLRAQREALIAAGATDAIQGSAGTDEIVTRVRALFLRSTAPRLLVVEDDADIAGWVQDVLSTAGHTVTVANDLRSARAAFASGPIDGLIIDRRLPDGDGLCLVEALRGQGIRTPALMFTAMSDPRDRVRGIEVGADDYICKPVHPGELRARVALMLRPKLRDDLLVFGPLEIARADGLVRWKGRRLELRAREYAFLVYLAERDGLAIPQKMLREDVWGSVAVSPESNPVVTTKSRLTRSLRAAGLPAIIETDEDSYRFVHEPLLRLSSTVEDRR